MFFHVLQKYFSYRTSSLYTQIKYVSSIRIRGGSKGDDMFANVLD